MTVRISAQVSQVGDVSTLRALLQAGCQQDLVGTCTHRKFRMICRVSDLMVRLKKHPRGIFIAHGLGTRCTALHTAALTGNIGALDLLLEHSADPASTKHSQHATPLHMAAYNGHQEIVNRLLGAGCPAGARDKRGRTAATWAKRRGQTELAAWLANMELAAGATRLSARKAAPSKTVPQLEPADGRSSSGPEQVARAAWDGDYCSIEESQPFRVSNAEDPYVWTGPFPLWDQLELLEA